MYSCIHIHPLIRSLYICKLVLAPQTFHRAFVSVEMLVPHQKLSHCTWLYCHVQWNWYFVTYTPGNMITKVNTLSSLLVSGYQMVFNRPLANKKVTSLSILISFRSPKSCMLKPIGDSRLLVGRCESEWCVSCNSLKTCPWWIPSLGTKCATWWTDYQLTMCT